MDVAFPLILDYTEKELTRVITTLFAGCKATLLGSSSATRRHISGRGSSRHVAALHHCSNANKNADVVCRCVELFDAVPQRHSRMHGNRARRCTFYVYTGTPDDYIQ